MSANQHASALMQQQAAQGNCLTQGFGYGLGYTPAPEPTLKERMRNRAAHLEATLASVDVMRKELDGLKAALEVMP